MVLVNETFEWKKSESKNYTLDEIKEHYEKYYKEKTLFDILMEESKKPSTNIENTKSSINDAIKYAKETNIGRIDSHSGGKTLKIRKYNRKTNARRNRRTKNQTRKRR